MRLALLLALGMVIAVLDGRSSVAVAGDGRPPPAPCRGAKACTELRYEPFLATFTARQTQVWMHDPGEAGIAIGEPGLPPEKGCRRRVLGGEGKLTLELWTPKPVRVVAVMRNGQRSLEWTPRWLGNEYWGRSAFYVPERYWGFGWVRYEVDPGGEFCGRETSRTVGSANPAACGRGATSGNKVQTRLAGSSRGSSITVTHWPGGVRGYELACPSPPHTVNLPLMSTLAKGQTDFQGLPVVPNTLSQPKVVGPGGVLSDKGHAAPVEFARFFDCRVRQFKSSLHAVSEQSGPSMFQFAEDRSQAPMWILGDPRSPSWPQWHLKSTLDLEFTFVRAGCGKKP